MDEFMFLFHGEKKIGKTSLSLQTTDEDDKVLLINFDPPQKAYRRMEIPMRSWTMYKKLLKKLERRVEKGNYPYRRVVLDGADIWFRRCQQYVCEKMAIDHPADAGWGKGWDGVRQEFIAGFDRLAALPGGKWFVCHSSWKEVETRDGDKLERLAPSLSKAAEEVLNGQVDGWFAYDYQGEGRVLILRGSQKIGAGHRVDTEDNPHFRAKDDKKPLRWIPMGTSPKEAYKNFVAAFENQLPRPSKKDR